MVQTSERPREETFAQRYLPAFQAYQQELLQRLETIINIDSGTGQVEGVRKVMAHLERWLGELGFRVEMRATDDYGPNLLARRRGKGRVRLLVVGHVDTVYAAGAVEEQPFSVRDGTAYGPGVIDMKSGVVMGIYALRALIEAGFEDYAELWVVFNNDEEVGSLGSGPLLREVAQHVDAALVLESSGSPEAVTKSRKGADKYVLEIAGVPAHSAEPRRGRSAVVELAHKIIAINNLNTLFYGVTFNVTRLSSSEPLNVVPNVARCHISVRAHDQRGLDHAAVALEQIAASTSVPGTRTVLTRNPGRRPYQPTPGLMQLVEMVQAEGRALGLEIVADSKGGVSDANLLMEAGVPALDSLGPIGGGMHDLNREYLRLDSLPVRGALLAGLIQRYCLSRSTGEETGNLTSSMT